MSLHAPPDGVCRLSLTFESDGVSRAVNVYHLYAAGIDAGDPAQVTDLLDDVVNAFQSSLIYAGQIADFGCTGTHIDVSDGTGIHSADGTAAGLVGTDSGDHVTGGIAVVISWLGDWHYRGGKPRTYIGGLSTTWMNTPVLLDGSHCADLQAAAVGLLDLIRSLSGSYGSAVSLGALLGNTAGSAGTFAPYAGARVRQTPASQRRRNHAS